MHRSDVFQDLEYLWATRHPDREKINAGQLVRCVYRRHNDQELAERKIGRYGLSAVNKIDDILVECFLYRDSIGSCRFVSKRKSMRFLQRRRLNRDR